MISGVSGYSGYSGYTSLQRSSAGGGGCAGDPARLEEKLFSLLDSDGSGGVAKEELESALSAARETDSSLTIDIDELFSQLDANGDGSLDSEETAALAPPPPPRGGPDPQEMFARLDANGDGSIDADELAALPGAGDKDSAGLLAELDADGDGGLNLDELSALAPPPPPQGAGNGGEPFGQLGSDSSSQDTLSSLLDAVAQQQTKAKEENDSGLIARLLKHYQDNAGYQESVGTRLSLSA